MKFPQKQGGNRRGTAHGKFKQGYSGFVYKDKAQNNHICCKKQTAAFYGHKHNHIRNGKPYFFFKLVPVVKAKCNAAKSHNAQQVVNQQFAETDIAAEHKY